MQNIDDVTLGLKNGRLINMAEDTSVRKVGCMTGRHASCELVA